MEKPAGDIIEIEWPGPLNTRKYVEQVMHNFKIVLTEITTGCGLRDERITPNAVHVELETESSNSDEDGC